VLLLPLLHPAYQICNYRAQHWKKTSGNIIILDLRYVGQTWKQPGPVHIELCDFMPENKAWKDCKQGEWIEAAATVKLMKASD